MTFLTLSRLTAAMSRGDAGTIHTLAPSRPVAGRIITYGVQLRRQGLTSIHVDPSVTLGSIPGGRLAAGFYLIGKTRSGNISTQETVYLAVRHGRALVVGDQPAQEW